MAYQDSKILREKYRALRYQGNVPIRAARLAGFKDPAKAVQNIRKNTMIEQDILQDLQQQTLESRYNREEVLSVIDEGINMGRIVCDGMTMIRGAQEINKMQGFYAPETKVIDLNADVNVRVHQLQSMGEEELLAALGQQKSFIDAEFIEVEDTPPPKRIASK
jgi:ribosomal protein S26